MKIVKYITLAAVAVAALSMAACHKETTTAPPPAHTTTGYSK
jgi:hypothetical protein